MSRAIGVGGSGGGGGAASSVTVKDGVDSGILATVKDYSNSNPVTVVTVDTNGDYIAPGGGGTQYDQGTVAGAADKLTMAGAMRRDTPAVDGGVANLDRVELSTDSVGRLWASENLVSLAGTAVATDQGNSTAGTLRVAIAEDNWVGANHPGKFMDAAVVADQVGIPALVQRSDTAGSLVGTDGDWTQLQTNATGALRVEAWQATSTNLKAQVNVASGGIASGAIASGAIASGAVASGAIASGAIAAGAIAAGATSIAANEDDASADLDRGVKVLAVRKATPANTSGTDGDYEFLQMSAGRIWASATIDAALPAGSAVIGHVIADSGSTTAVTGTVTVAGAKTNNNAAPGATNVGTLPGIANAAAPSWTEGNQVALSTDLAGALRVTGAGGGTQYTEDVAAAADPVGTAMNLIRNDTPSSSTVSADGDNIAARASSTGAQYVELLSGTAKIGGDATNGLDVDITRMSALVAGAALIGKVGIDQTTPGTTNAVQANVASGGIASGAIASGAVASGAVASGAFASGSIASGALASGSIASGAIAAGAIAAGATSIADNEDAASADADRGVKILFKRKDTPANSSGTDLDYEQPQMSAGRVWASANVDQINGVTPLMGNGATGTGSLRVTIANDNSAIPTVTTVTTVSTLTGGGVADDGADSGNPVKVGAKALKNPATATMVADADRTDLSSDLDKAVRVKGWTTGADLISTSQSVTATTSTAATNFGAVASTKNFITSVTVHNAHATTNGFISLQDGSGGTTIWVFPLPATGGATHNFDPPLKQPTANTALYFAASAAITTIYISINGFQSKCY